MERKELQINELSSKGGREHTGIDFLAQATNN